MKRKVLVVLLMLWQTMVATAQRNPVEGYIITLSNDTVMGTIDYLTDVENCRACVFKALGESTFKTYGPDEIRAYRFADNGVYYVSRDLMVHGEDIKAFVEFLLQGGVSLYHYTDKHDHYLFVNEQGKMSELIDDHLDSHSMDYPNKVRARRGRMADMQAVLYKDKKTVEQLLTLPYESRPLTALVRRYDERFCTEEGDCVQFQYDRKRSRLYSSRRLRFEAGYVLGVYDGGDGRNKAHMEMPRVGIGLEVRSARIDPNLSLLYMLSFSYLNLRGHFSPDRYHDPDDEWHDKAPLIELSVGGAYRFCPQWRHRPYVHGAVSLVDLTIFGLQAGVGYDFAIGSKQHLQLSAGGHVMKTFSSGGLYFTTLNLAFVL